MLAAVLCCNAADDRFSLGCRGIGTGNSGAVTQPYIDIRKVLHILGEKGLAQALADQDAAGEKHQRTCDERLAMFERIVPELVVETGDSVRAAVLDRRE